VLPVSRSRVITARVIAVAADAVQLALVPLVAEGAASLLNDAIDVAVAIALWALVGWHWAFLPSFLTKLIPFVDLAPTWTIAVLLVTRHGAAASPAAPAPPPLPQARPPVA
jgi:hypothetical protein